MRDIEFQRGDMVLVKTMARTLVVALDHQKPFVSPLPYYERETSYSISIEYTPVFLTASLHRRKGRHFCFCFGKLAKRFW